MLWGPQSHGEAIHNGRCSWQHKSASPGVIRASEQTFIWLHLPACKSSSTSKFFQGGPRYCGPETVRFWGFLSKFLSYRLCKNNEMIDLSHSALGYKAFSSWFAPSLWNFSEVIFLNELLFFSSAVGEHWAIWQLGFLFAFHSFALSTQGFAEPSLSVRQRAGHGEVVPTVDKAGRCLIRQTNQQTQYYQIKLAFKKIYRDFYTSHSLCLGTLPPPHHFK